MGELLCHFGLGNIRTQRNIRKGDVDKDDDGPGHLGPRSFFVFGDLKTWLVIRSTSQIGLLCVMLMTMTTKMQKGRICFRHHSSYTNA